jgi:ABC-type multidrug transport system fused ATPase/permease subunit
LRNPDILILDEPTAALDSISEHKITQLITEMMKGKTVIVIAHRLQTVMNANRIIVMDHGQIIQS